MTDVLTHSRALQLTAQIVSAQVGHNAIQADALPALIQSVFNTLTGAGQPSTEAEVLKPAVPVKKSVFPDYLICLEDGKKLKMLKRHLQTSYDMTPEQYRDRWNLPADYPMVAPNYAARRSVLAKSIGLGRKPREVEPAPAAAPPPVEPVHVEPPVVKATRGRKKAASA